MDADGRRRTTMLTARPLFLITVAYLAGIVCAAQEGLSAYAGLTLTAGMILAALFLPRKKIPRPLVGMLAVVFALGFARTAVYRQVPAGDISQYAEGKLVYLTGRVASDLEPIENDARFVLRVSRVKTYGGESAANGDVMVGLYRSLSGGGVVPSFGEVIRIHGRLMIPHEPSNPGAFDYGHYLARKRIFCTLSAYTNEVVVLKPPSASVTAVAMRFKHALFSIASRLFPPKHAALLLGILLGNYAALPLAVQSAFMRSGTMHLLAASGYNCGVVVLISSRILRWLAIRRAAVYCLLIALVWAYTLVVGGNPSIVRAAVMVTAVLIAYLIRRVPDFLNLVLFAVLVILAANPMDLYDAGFQLSFSAVLGLVLVMPLVTRCVGDWLMVPFDPGRRPPSRVSRWTLVLTRDVLLTLGISIVCMLWTAPISAYYFNYLSSISIFANALVALLVVMLTAAGIAALVVGWIWLPLGKVVALLGTGIAELMLRIVDGLGTHPWSSISVASPKPVFLIAYYVVLFVVSDYAYRKSTPPKRTAGDMSPGYRRRVDLVTGREERA
jgi:competence protein ComEC